MTRDNVFFYCCQAVMKRRSLNLFGRILPSGSPRDSMPPSSIWSPPAQQVSLTYTWDGTMSPGSGPQPVWEFDDRQHHTQLDVYTTSIDEPSQVLNVIMHIVYQMPIGRYGPSLDVMEQALTRLWLYGIPTPAPDGPCDIWALILRQAPRYPMRVYAIAAAHAMDQVCVAANTLSEADAVMMGAIYLRRLMFLHLGRQQALYRVISEPPKMHAPTASCSKESQVAANRLWQLGVGDLMVHAAPHRTSVGALVEAFGPIVHATKCPTCGDGTRARITEVMKEWDTIKRTI
ncbi:hypothetical protein FRB97_007251 [Tulasnella sp. 331]|nr:hypothetical protein FRB97_007251 [Tulasnella sp. 331]KAG8886026.1 hypothetical protein FRB98_001502 [Tulasnella sp. 332]